MSETRTRNQLLTGIEVLELGEGLASSICGQILSDLGATVIKIEPVGGDWLRGHEPQTDDSVSLAYRNCSINKQIITASSEDDYRSLVRSYAGRVDAVLDHPDSHSEAVFQGELFSDIAELVLCNLQDDASDSGVKLGEVGAQAVSGLSGYLGSVAEPPRIVRADVASTVAGVFAAQAIIAALLAKGRSGRGTTATVSLARSIASIKTLTWAAQNAPDAWLGFHCNAESGPVQIPYFASDGPISFDLQGVDKESYDTLAADLGLEMEMEGRTPSDIAGFGDDAMRYRDRINAALSHWTAADIGVKVQQARGISVPYSSLNDVAQHPQVEEIAPFRTVDGGPELYVTLPISSAINDNDLDEASSRVNAGVPFQGGGSPQQLAHHGPLAGIKVLDLGIAGVGPWGATLLAQLGATVTKIEPPSGDMIHQVEPDQNGYRTTYAALNLGKHVVSLDLKNAEDLKRLETAIAESHVISENFRPGVMKRLGLTTERIQELNPTIVTFSSTGYGASGAMAGRRATDGHIQALSGFASANGRDGVPEVLRYNGFVDLLTSTFNCVATLAGLLHQQRTGLGSAITNTMLGTALFAEQVALASVQAGCTESIPLSERSEYAPSGAFRTRDGWIAIEARNDREWDALVRVLEAYAPSPAEGFGTNRARCEQRVSLRSWIESATTQLPTRAWLLALRRTGVPSSAFVRDAENLRVASAGEDQLIARVRGAGIGEMYVGALPWSFSSYECAVGQPPVSDEDSPSLPESLKRSSINT